MNKYNARKISLNGQTFDSQHEFDRWCELSLLQRGKAISDLQRQVKFGLLPEQKDENGKVIERAVSYIADFVYTDNHTGQTVIEDAKGVRTKEYILKRKMMLYFYGVRIKEV